MDKIFSFVFAAIGVMLLIASLCGATHQLVLAALCAVMALMMWPNDKEMLNNNKF